MSISAIRPISLKGVSFGNKRIDKDGYENPVNRKTERNLAILSTVGTGALIGVTAGGLTSCLKKGWKVPTGVGVAATALSLILMLPSKIYNKSLTAFAKEKEMSVFSRQKEAQANLYNDINNEIKDEEVSLDEKINHYTTVKMADNGKALMVKGA